MGDSRFSVLGQPTAAPGHCLICRSTVNGPFIDTGLNIQWEGAVYICNGCITEMYHTLPEHAASGELELVRAFNAGQKVMADRVEASVDGLLRNLRAAVMPTDYSTVVAPAVESASDNEADSGDSSAGDSGDDGSSEQGDSANSEQGPDDVPSDSSDGFRLEV